MRFLVLAAAALVLEGLRLAWLSRLPAAPDPLLGMVVLLALARRPAGGAVAGFFLGALRDLVLGSTLGAETAVFTLAGWSVSSLGRSIYRDAALTQAVMMLVVGLGRGAVLYVILVGEDIGGFAAYLLRTALPTAAATAVVVPLVVHLAGRLRAVRPRRHRPVHESTALDER